VIYLGWALHGDAAGHKGRVTSDSDFATASEGTAQPVAGPEVTGRPRRRWWLSVSVGTLGVVAGFACYLRLADTRAVNTDGAAQALPAWAMLHGNLLLHGWQIGDVSFYTTEVPEYALVELVRGLNAGVVHVAAAITYTLVVLLAALLAKGRTTGRPALVRVLITVGILVAPQLVQGINVLISSPDHIGTAVPVLLAWIIVDRARPRWYVPVAVAVVLGWAAVADSLVLIIGVLPLVLVCLLRVIRAKVVLGGELRTRWYELALGAGALAGFGASQLAMRLISAAGGFQFRPTGGQIISSFSVVPQQLSIAGQGVLLLFGADFIGQHPDVATAVMVVHVVGVALAGLGVLVAALRFVRGRSLVDQVLVAGVVFNLAAYAFSTLAASIYQTREIAPVLPLSAVLAGRLIADRIPVTRPARIALLAVLVGYLAGLGYELTAPPVPAQNQQIASWLETHHFRSGLSGYWESDVVTLTTGNRVRVAPVLVVGKRLQPWYHPVKSSWFDPRESSANFVVLGPTDAEYQGFTAVKPVVATFGSPAHEYHVGRYEVLTYAKNLLTDLH
jgi:hypothetical protein